MSLRQAKRKSDIQLEVVWDISSLWLDAFVVRLLHRRCLR
jgi:hypothetical protein